MKIPRNIKLLNHMCKKMLTYRCFKTLRKKQTSVEPVLKVNQKNMLKREEDSKKRNSSQDFTVESKACLVELVHLYKMMNKMIIWNNSKPNLILIKLLRFLILKKKNLTNKLYPKKKI